MLLESTVLFKELPTGDCLPSPLTRSLACLLDRLVNVNPLRFLLYFFFLRQEFDIFAEPGSLLRPFFCLGAAVGGLIITQNHLCAKVGFFKGARYVILRLFQD